MRLLVALTLLTISYTALGAVNEPASTFCFNFKNINFVSIQAAANESCDQFSGFDSTISEMSSLKLTSENIYLGSLVVSKFQLDNWGSEDWNLGTIFISTKKNDSSFAESTSLIFPHEIGHLILDAYSAQKIPILKQFKVIKDRNWLYLKYFMPILQLTRTNSDCDQPESVCAQKVKSLISASPIDLNGPSPSETRATFYAAHKSELDRFDEIVLPYHEFFADLVQALYFDNPAINNKASLGFGMQPESCRTFDEVLPTHFQSDDPHCSLSGIRTKVWNLVVKPMLPQKKAILSKVADAIWAEVEPQLRDNYLKLTANEASEKLLQRLLQAN